jgi:glyoxylase-like metal-dependent hydrolase (beta-lactamase superfamily II)
VVTLDEQPILVLDDAHPVSVSHVPGHTAGGVTFRLGRALFTGDTLLPGEAGRFDLPGGDAAQLQQSLLALRTDLQPHDMVCPGHGPCWQSNDAIEWLSQAAGRG